MMNRILLTISVSMALGLPIPASAQTPGYTPPLGTKTLYAAGADTDAPAPKGYTPFFINYVGRHGARHATGTAELARLDQFLQEANAKAMLRPEGVRLAKMVGIIYAVEKQYPSGSLTAVGEEEQFRIGKDMGDRYPGVVRQSEDCLEIVSTPEQRTVQSADHFLKGLGSNSACVTRTPDDSVRLRFFSLSPNYRDFEKRGEWKKVQAKLEMADTYQQIDLSILNKLFDSTLVKTLEDGSAVPFSSPNAFGMALYSAAVIAPGLKDELKKAGYTPADADIFSLLTPREAAGLAFVDAAKDFFVKGPGLDAQGIQVRVAAPLLIDFLQSSDEWLKAGKKGADLRFAHAETLAPFAALLGCEGSAAAVSNPFTYDQVWKSDRVIGYSANIQWVFYRRGEDVLLKVLYNEQPIHLPVATNQYPYYQWKDVRAYYLRKLHMLNADPGQDMYTYLRELK